MVETEREEAKRAKRSRARQRQLFLSRSEPDVDQAELSEAMARVQRGTTASGRPRARSRAATPQAFPSSDAQRWVSIGPSVVRRGQAVGRPRVTGRIRDLAVEPVAGVRAYAASAKGGVWYTGDAGSTWQPVGGWAAGQRGAGGHNTVQSCGSLLVSFGATAANDLVMVGTGEPPGDRPSAFTTTHGGVGVLSARGPAAAAPGVAPWEPESGLALMRGVGIYRLARDPNALLTAGKTNNPNRDRVIAATTAGLFLGLRTRVPVNGGTPAHDEFRWTALTGGLNAAFGTATPHVTDVLWLPGGANGRIVITVAAAAANQGVAVSPDLGVNFNRVGLALPPTAWSRCSLASAGATNRVYVLGERTVAGVQTPDLWQIPSVAVAAPAAAPLGGVPIGIWTVQGNSQRDYDQAIAVDVVGGTDRVYLGGSVVVPAAGDTWSGSVWAFQVNAAAPRLTPIVGVSATGVPPGGDGADQAGLVGNNVHGDIHSIEVAGPPAQRQVWVGCDGGVFRSDRAGRVNSFQARNTGLATLEVGFHAPHPTSSHFGAIGCQDNGSQVRIGDTVWEETFVGDGGGTTFHPTRSQYVITQWVRGSWFSSPRSGFVGPLVRAQGGGVASDAENGSSSFYSGIAAIANSPTESRVAIGTNRVWLSDDIGRNPTNTWRVIGFPNGPGSDPPAPAAAPAWLGIPQQAAPPGPLVPANALGWVVTLKWASPTNLLALYQWGIVRYTQAGANWATTFVVAPGIPGGPLPLAGDTILTDIAPVPAVGGADINDFYVTTTGRSVAPGATAAQTATAQATDTCFFFDASAGTFTPTNLRRQLDPAVGTPGPLDPAYSVVVDPTAANTVFVGTMTGVWRATRGGANAHAWAPMVNGLPEATVQDLSIWTDPGGAPGPRMLRAAVQSRGVWEVDLAAGAESQRTFVRVHERDDRRRFPTPMDDVRRRPGFTVPSHVSPDIVLRPQWPMATAPRWIFGNGSIASSARNGFQLWTFQTAFRWIYPSIPVDGNWSDQLGDLVQMHRQSLGLSVQARIDRALWDAVVGGTRLTPTGAVSAAPANPLAVYRAPWQHAGALAASGTEIDFIESVRPWDVRSNGSLWRVHNEPVTIDVLLHHRDSRPLPVDDAFAIVLWRSTPTQSAALNPDVSGFPAYARSLLTPPAAPDPAGWSVARTAASPLHRLGQTLDSRLPTAVSIDVDFSGIPDWHRVLVVAIVGSNTDPLTTAPSGPVTDPDSLVRNWPHATMRLLQMRPRP